MNDNRYNTIKYDAKTWWSGHSHYNIQ